MKDKEAAMVGGERETLQQIKTVLLIEDLKKVNELLISGWILLDAKIDCDGRAKFLLGTSKEVSLPWRQKFQPGQDSAT